MNTELLKTIQDAIKKTVPKKRIAIAFSGGVDSTRTSLCRVPQNTLERRLRNVPQQEPGHRGIQLPTVANPVLSIAG